MAMSLAALHLRIALLFLISDQGCSLGEDRLSVNLTGSSGDDMRSICASGQDGKLDLQKFGLPEIVAVNWGQWHGPYALPPERLVVCASGRGFLWKWVEQGKQRFVVSMEELGSAQITQLFSVILTEWPQGSLERKGQDGKFIWLLDADNNFIVAPVMQARGAYGGIEEVKHGDLSPGVTFFGNNGASGLYRGVARFGGEFNLAGLRDGREWMMHAKSGYTAYRVSVDKAKGYYHEKHSTGVSDAEIARNFQRCVFREIFRGRTPLTRLLCYLRRHLQIKATLGVTQQCDIRAKLVDGLPNLGECVPKDQGDDQICGGTSDAAAARELGRAEGPIVHLVDWYAPGQDRCNLTLAEYDALVQNVADNVRTFVSYHPSVASSSGGRAYAKSISKQIRSLRKHACLFTESFTQQLLCNVHGCFGEGFTQELKKIDGSFGGVLTEGGERLRTSWEKAMQAWRRCKSGSDRDEL